MCVCVCVCVCVSQNRRLPRGAMLRFRYKSYVTSSGEDERVNPLRRPRTTPALLPRPLSSPPCLVALTFTISSHNRWSASWRRGMLQIVYKFLPQQHQNLLAWISLPRSALWSYHVPPDFSDVRNFPQYLFNPLNPELNPICYLLALLEVHFLHVSRIRVKSLTLRLLMPYIYIYIYIYIWSAYSWCF